jgi:hypothetical protein
MMVYTPKINNILPLSISVEGKSTQSISFRVRACMDATIYLSEYRGVIDNFAYEVIIGHNNEKYC